jgi:hypothetical protein
MRFGREFQIHYENDHDRYEWNPATRWDYWELPRTSQRQFIQYYVEVDNNTLNPLLEAYYGHDIFNNDDESVMTFSRARSHLR